MWRTAGSSSTTRTRERALGVTTPSTPFEGDAAGRSIGRGTVVAQARLRLLLLSFGLGAISTHHEVAMRRRGRSEETFVHAHPLVGRRRPELGIFALLVCAVVVAACGSGNGASTFSPEGGSSGSHDGGGGGKDSGGLHLGGGDSGSDVSSLYFTPSLPSVSLNRTGSPSKR